MSIDASQTLFTFERDPLPRGVYLDELARIAEMQSPRNDRAALTAWHRLADRVRLAYKSRYGVFLPKKILARHAILSQMIALSKIDPEDYAAEIDKYVDALDTFFGDHFYAMTGKKDMVVRPSFLCAVG